MKTMWLVVLLVCVAVGGAWAQGIDWGFAGVNPLGMGPRQLSMGGVGIGVADDAYAWVQNPAGLAALNVPAAEGKSWGHDAQIYNLFPQDSDYNMLGASWSGWKPEDNFGVGAGVMRFPEFFNIAGIGVGTTFRKTRLAVGANVVDYNIEMIGQQTNIFNVGAMYTWKDIRIGGLVDNATQADYFGLVGNRVYGAGLSWQVSPKLLLAADGLDLTDVFDMGRFFNFGGELKWSPALTFRAGMLDDGIDNNLTLGAGFNHGAWRIDAAYGKLYDHTLWNVGVGLNF
jgi:hypothetical protein